MNRNDRKALLRLHADAKRLIGALAALDAACAERFGAEEFTDPKARRQSHRQVVRSLGKVRLLIMKEWGSHPFDLVGEPRD